MDERKEKLLAVGAWLGTSFHAACSSGNDTNTWHDLESPAIKAVFSECRKGENGSLLATFPSFSLEHANHFDNNSSKSKEEIQMQASSWLSNRMQADLIDENSLEGEHAPRVILSNLYSSFDKLVDARILAFSKILGGHGLTIAQSMGDLSTHGLESPSAEVLGFKLKTLLEIGTSIYADSVTTRFIVSKDPESIDQDHSVVISVPIALKVEIANIHLPCSASGDAMDFAVTFEAPGTIEGTFRKDEPNSIDVDVDIDCDVLLRSMVREATKVVENIVDLTNAAWNQVNESAKELKREADQKSTDTKVPLPDGIRSLLPSKRPLPLIPIDLDDYEQKSGLSSNDSQDNKVESDLDLDEEPMPAENISAIVDYAISEIDTTAIAPPAFKKHRIIEST